MSANGLPAQPVDATLALGRKDGVYAVFFEENRLVGVLASPSEQRGASDQRTPT